MFKLKPGNVIQKLNNMDRKKAYTIGAVLAVLFVALLMLSSFLGVADDDSLDGMKTRGYDLAQMPFLNDEAEAYLLASKYPDMQENGGSLLYSPQQRAEREEADVQNEEESDNEYKEEEPSNSNQRSNDYDSDDGYDGSHYGGRGYGGRGRGSTPIGTLGSAGVSSARGSGVNSTWGGPRMDVSPYKSQDKGKEIQEQLKNSDARKALFQTAQGSRAAAGLKDAKGANAKRALMGGDIKGGNAFTDKGVDMSKLGGLELDTNAPVTSADLSNLEKNVTDGANKAKENQNNNLQNQNNSMWDRLQEQIFSGLINMGLNAVGNSLNKVVDSLWASSARNSATKVDTNLQIEKYGNMTATQFNALSKEQQDVVGNFFGLARVEGGWDFPNGNTLKQVAGNSSLFKQNQATRDAYRQNKGLFAIGDEGKPLEISIGAHSDQAGHAMYNEYLGQHSTPFQPSQAPTYNIGGGVNPGASWNGNNYTNSTPQGATQTTWENGYQVERWTGVDGRSYERRNGQTYTILNGGQ